MADGANLSGKARGEVDEDYLEGLRLGDAIHYDSDRSTGPPSSTRLLQHLDVRRRARGRSGVIRSRPLQVHARFERSDQ